MAGACHIWTHGLTDVGYKAGFFVRSIYSRTEDLASATAGRMMGVGISVWKADLASSDSLAKFHDPAKQKMGFMRRRTRYGLDPGVVRELICRHGGPVDS
jgi:hypothetical protein